MAYFFVNLKRFDIPKTLGGICLYENSEEWITNMLDECIEEGLGFIKEEVVLLLPESLLITAKNILSKGQLPNFHIGSQGVYRENTKFGGNFGAFTTFFPSSAASSLGCSWSIIGHSEERKSYHEILRLYDLLIEDDKERLAHANATVNSVLEQEMLRAFESNMNVLLCVGEKEKGKAVIEVKDQLDKSLESAGKYLNTQKLVIGYEPMWAIGPGKTPPKSDYINEVATFIKELTNTLIGVKLPVVYGGGLKEENAPMLRGIETIDGGLIALTKFTGNIAFEPSGLKSIIEAYTAKGNKK